MTQGSTIRHQLEEIHKKLMSLKAPAPEAYVIYEYELMPLINSHPALKETYEYRLSKKVKMPPGDPFYWIGKPENEYVEMNIAAFERFNLIMESQDMRQEYLSSQAEFLELQSTIDSVMKMLIHFSGSLEGNVQVAKRKGRPPEAKYISGTIWYDDKSCSIPANSKLASLCQKFFGSSVKFAEKIYWGDLFEELYGIEPDSNDSWRKIDNRVRNLNDILQKSGIPPLLKFEGGSNGYVSRSI